jgi:hypothetical protein
LEHRLKFAFTQARLPQDAVCYAIGLEPAFLKETIETELSPSRTVYWDIVNLFRKGIVTTKKPPERNIAKTFLPAWECHRRRQSAAMGGHRTLEG